jgi:uncharacterized membrane protein YkvA (DUF1232 family)
VIEWRELFGAANRARLFRCLTALWLLARDPRAPLAPKLVALLVLAYALSPIDLIPDFIPVLGLLDDLILIPLGVMLAVKLVPPALWQETLVRADAHPGRLPKMMSGLLLVAAVWALVAAALVWFFFYRMPSA